MQLKKIVSIVLVLLGLGVFLLAMYAKQRVMEVKKSIHHESSIIPDNPVNTQIKKALENKISSYDMPIMWGIIGGITFIVIGVGTLVYGKRR